MKEKFKPNKKEGGITLIALIITIIILVILAVVSIRAVYDMGIMRYAVNTAEDYSEAVQKEESILGSLENVLATHKVGETVKTVEITLDKQEGSGGTDTVTVAVGSSIPEIEVPERTGYTFQGYYESAEGQGTKYIDEEGNSATEWDKEEDTVLYAYWTYSAEYFASKIGKYVDYQSIINAKESKTIYDTSSTGDNTNVSYSGEDSKYKLTWTRQDLTWRILDVDEDENIVRLIAATPDTQTLTLNSYNGYNNAVKILNDICSNCYGSSVSGVTARSINIEDLERNGIGNVGTGSASMATRTSMTYRMGGVPTISLSEVNQYPQGTSSGSHTLGRSDQTGWVTGTSSFGSSYQFAYTYYSYTLSSFSNTAAAPYYAIFSNQTGTSGANNPTTYWIASRCVFHDSYIAFFCAFIVDSTSVSTVGFYDTSCNTRIPTCAVRPVVEIPLSSVNIGATGTGDSGSPYSIAAK